MTVVPITIVPHPVLRQVSSSIEKIDADIRRMVTDLTDTFTINQTAWDWLPTKLGLRSDF